MTHNREMFGTLDNLNARIDAVLWLAGQAYGTKGSDLFIEFVEDCEETDLIRMFPQQTEDWAHLESLEDSRDILDLFVERKLFGFCVKMSTPIRTYSPKKDSYTAGWGMYRYRWFYADTLEEALVFGMEWVKRMHEADRNAQS